MLSVVEAQKRVVEQLQLLPAQAVPAGDALGLVLAEDVASDLDMPPYDKALMDGFAVRADGGRELAVIEEVLAGQVPRRRVEPGQATRIMTGAPVPQGADAVVMSERCRMVSPDRVLVVDAELRPGHNILPRGREMRSGEVVVRAGARLRPQELGLIAAVGRSSVQARPRPSVGVLATGDELVPVTERPGPGQIRNSNAAMLCAQVERAGGVARPLGIARDEPGALRERVSAGLELDVLLLSGGVSAGKRDLVPGVLAELGVAAVFHQVAMKPGKPLLFGVKGRRLVFGLPGNPVASLVCFELFVRPALRGLMGLPPAPHFVEAALARDYPYRTDRPTYHPAHLQATGTGWSVDPVPWFGSPDLRGVGAADAFVLFPTGDHAHRAREVFPVLCVDEIW
jgi:molybdopterin molybdotransferase